MMKRIFIAVKVDADDLFSEIISSLRTSLANENIRWVNKDNIHITLFFLGDTEEETISTISTMMKETCGGSGKFELVLKGLGVFRHLSNPRVIWAGIEFPRKFSNLHMQIKNGLKNYGLFIEEHPFKPHLTIGRVKYLEDKTVLKALVEKYRDKEIQKIIVDKVILYESILLPSGPVYKPLITVEL